MTAAVSLSVRGAAAAVLTGAFGAYALVGGSPGLGFPLTALAIAGTVALSEPSVTGSRDARIFGALALTLATMTALRDAEWVVALDVLAAIGLAAWAVAGVGSWRSLVGVVARGLFEWLSAPLRIVRELSGALDHPRRERLRPALRGSVLGFGLVLVFGALFVTADSAFAQITTDLLEQNWDARLWPARVGVGVLVSGLAGGLVLTHRRTRPASDTGGDALDSTDPFGPRSSLRDRIRARSEWVVPLVLLDLLFLSFVVVQVAVLFGGRDHVLASAGVTYAEYARSGFFQLLAVAFLTLLLIAIAVNAGHPSDRRDGLLLRVLLGILCFCTLVILVSAFQRLRLYEETFGFTRLRIAVHAMILWLACLFGLVVAAGVRMKGAWLPRAVIVLTATFLVAGTLIDPDQFIAGQNVRRYKVTGKIDIRYLSTLSADAIPALVGLPDDKLGCLLPAFEQRLAFDEPLMSANLAREHARRVLQTEGAQPEDCAPLIHP